MEESPGHSCGTEGTCRDPMEASTSSFLLAFTAISSAVNMTFKLNNGELMPALGLGTATIYGYSTVLKSVRAAIVDSKYKCVETVKQSYYLLLYYNVLKFRLIDTATYYRNEADIGRALKELGINRKDVFITSKLLEQDQGRERAPKAIKASLKALQTDYLDLYLIHFPTAWGLDHRDERNAILRRESWEVLVEYQKKGVLRSIGVSNYRASHLKDLLAHSPVTPQVNQILFSPLHQPDDNVLDFCREHNIHITAYSSLNRRRNHNHHNNLLASLEVSRAARSCGEEVTPAQVLLRWALEKGHSVIPRSRSPEHIEENTKLMHFTLTEDATNILNNMKE